MLLSRLAISSTASAGPPASVVERARKAAAVLVQLNPEDCTSGTDISDAQKATAVADVQQALAQLHEIMFDVPFSPMARNAVPGGSPSSHGAAAAAPEAYPVTANIDPAIDGLAPLPLPLPTASATTIATAAAANAPTAALVQLMIQPDVNLPLLLLLSIMHLGFEYRKLVVTLFKHCFKADEAFRDYCCIERLLVLDFLFEGYTPARRDICVNCHNMLDECVTRDPRAVDRLLRSRFLASFFESYALSTDFEVQSKALALLSRALKQHPKTTAKFLKDPENRSAFFVRYNDVLNTGNYVSTVQLLSLLSDLLMVRKNRKVMVAYVSEKANLMVIMKLLRHKSASIAYEAFHVFKIFVANPAKPDRVLFVFTQNSKKLIKFMKKFQNVRNADEPEFAEEKQTVIDSLKEMAKEAAKGAAAAGLGT